MEKATEPWCSSSACHEEEGYPYGPLGQLAPIEDELLRFIFELHKQGMAVSISMIVIKASILDAGFASKTKFVKYFAVRHFVKAHLMVY